MNNRNKITKLQFALKAVLTVGAIGAILTIIIAAIFGIKIFSIVPVIILSFFAAVLLSSVFLILLLKKAIKYENSRIFEEFETPQSKYKIYKIYCIAREKMHRISQPDRQLALLCSTIKFGFFGFGNRINKMIFLAEGFQTQTGKDFRSGDVSFLWNKVGKVILDAGKKQIQLYFYDKFGKVIYLVNLPYKENILMLVKTFYPFEVEIENITEASENKKTKKGKLKNLVVAENIEQTSVQEERESENSVNAEKLESEITIIEKTKEEIKEDLGEATTTIAEETQENVDEKSHEDEPKETERNKIRRSKS